MARMIIRTSINGPSPNSQQQQLRKVLEDAGFKRIGTGAYEGDMPDPQNLRAVIRKVLDFLDNQPSQFNVDHLWIYADDN